MSDQEPVREEDEIVRYYEKIRANDKLGVWGEELLMRVPLGKAEKFMKPDHGWTEETWEKCRRPATKEQIVAEIEDYFQHAVEKAISHKGISASATVHHFMAWTWLIKDLEMFAYLMDPRNYPNYGCPMILAVGQKYELLEMLPDNKIDREVFFRMAQGMVCGGMCNGGCRPGSPQQFRSRDIVMPLPGETKGLILPK